jgi:murein DD-endopeptidase MepM/ murein hydrolase activator NlpD
VISRKVITLGLVVFFFAALAGNMLTGKTGSQEAEVRADRSGSGLISRFIASGPAASPEMAEWAALPAARAEAVETAHADTLRSGESLSELLARARFERDEASALLTVLSEFRDLRRLTPGLVLGYGRSLTDGRVRRMDVALDPDHVLAVRRGDDGWAGEIVEVPVEYDTVVVAGEVRSSLYAAMLSADGDAIPPREREVIVDALADQVFAWVIDFSRDLRRGDRFRVLYERAVRPDGSARTGAVLAVQFNVDGRNYEAYRFDADEETHGYFDEEGNSMRRAFLRAPLRYRRISSVYTDSRMHPVLGVRRPHRGVDYAAPRGTPIFAAGDGVVTRATRSGGYGNVIDIRHTRGYATRYAHLDRFAGDVRPGVRVKQGDVIGYVGSTGLATGPHLHYEFHSRGRAVDPRTVRDLSGDPVPEEHRSAFNALIGQHVVALDQRTEPVLLARADDRIRPVDLDGAFAD